MAGSDPQLAGARRTRRVLFVGAARVPRTGGERYSAAVIDAMLRRGWRVDAVTPDDLPRGHRRNFPASNLWLIRRAGAARSLVIVEDFFWHPRTFVFNWWMRVRGARVVCIVHHLSHDLRPVAWQRWADRVISAVSLVPVQRVIVNSANTADAVALLGVPRRRMMTIAPGVDRIPPGERPSHASAVGAAFRLLVVGNVDRRKGLNHLLDAVALLPVEVTVEIVGREDYDPDFRAELAAQITRLGLSQRVAFRGRLEAEELADAYRTADAFVVPSLWEGFGIALLEAMLHGLPVIATDVGAIPELVEDGDTGLLVPPADPSGLAGSVKRLLADRAFAQVLGTRARAKALRVARRWDEVGDAVASAVERLAGR